MVESPVIGITVSIDHGKVLRKNMDYFYVKRAYAQAVNRAGGRPILITPDISPREVTELCDGVVISGGDDIPPQLYGEEASSLINFESEERILWERKLIDVFLEEEKPLLGVCYGLQLINVHFGGSLHQDIHYSHPGALEHGGLGKVTSHEVKIAEDSFLFPLFGPKAIVSSNHHQGVKRLAPGFRAAATSGDGLIEAIQHGKIIAVEWHPESDSTGDEIYSLLTEWSKRNGVRDL